MEEEDKWPPDPPDGRPSGRSEFEFGDDQGFGAHLSYQLNSTASVPDSSLSLHTEAGHHFSKLLKFHFIAGGLQTVRDDSKLPKQRLPLKGRRSGTSWRFTDVTASRCSGAISHFSGPYFSKLSKSHFIAGTSRTVCACARSLDQGMSLKSTIGGWEHVGMRGVAAILGGIAC